MAQQGRGGSVARSQQPPSRGTVGGAVPIARGLFTWPVGDDSPHLIGGTCRMCPTTVFPYQDSCPRCTGQTMEEVLLPSSGTLWSFTVQNFKPKEPYIGPSAFVPYGVGYIDLGDVVIEARLEENDASRLRIGQRMTLALVPFETADPAAEVVSYVFRSAEDGTAAEGDLDRAHR